MERVLMSGHNFCDSVFLLTAVNNSSFGGKSLTCWVISLAPNAYFFKGFWEYVETTQCKKKITFSEALKLFLYKLTCLTSSQTDTLVTHSHTCTPHTCTPHTCTPHTCTPHTVLRCQLARAQRTLLTCCQWDRHAALQFGLLTMDWEPQSSIWLASSPSHHAPGSRRDIFNSSKERQ